RRRRRPGAAPLPVQPHARLRRARLGRDRVVGDRDRRRARRRRRSRVAQPTTHRTKEVRTMPATLLTAERVRKVYRSAGADVEALKGLDLTVPEGQFLAVMGPSGSGKTTLLNCLSGLDEIDAGRVVIDGLSIHELSDAKRT